MDQGFGPLKRKHMEGIYMGSEPIKNPDNKVMVIVGWLGILGAIILAATGKYKEDKQLGMIFYQSLVWGIICFVPIIGVLAWIFILIGFILSLTGKVWQTPILGGWARDKAYGK